MLGCGRAVARRGSDMTAAHHPIDFICPGCGAGYKVVRIKAEADPAHRLIHCRVCKRSLAPTDREYILKYFLIGRKRAGKQRVSPEPSVGNTASGHAAAAPPSSVMNSRRFIIRSPRR